MKASELLGPEGPLARVIPGYEHREGQIRMAEAVESALADRRVLLVEAGTGTGKTLAYLLPAIASGRRVVISTGTKTLQDQIMEHDLPLLREHLDVPVRAAVMKGLSNYVCRRRLSEFLGGERADDRRYRKSLPIIQRFAEESVTGDRAAATELSEDDPIWAHVASGSDTRVGRGCRYYESCFVTRMRARAEEAQLVIVNHHLFFADLATRAAIGGGRGGLIPPYDALVFDEAHQIEDIATLFFGRELGTSALERLADDLIRTRDPDAEGMASAVVSAGARFFAAVPLDQRGPATGRTHLHRGVFHGELEDALFALDDALARIEEHAHATVGGGDPFDDDPARDRWGLIARRAAGHRDALVDVSETPTEGKRVAYGEARGRARVIGTSPVDVSDLLRDEVLLRTESVVLTSATLTTDGDFRFIRERLGVDFEAREERVASPFDFERQVGLYLPEGMPDPRSPDYAERARDEIVSLIRASGGGAFVLCTSRGMMRRLASECAAELPFEPLVQGDAPKAELLRRFRDSGDAMLFATMSFWEGVDVPGDALRCVIIDKLPFSVPSDPLVAARCRSLEERGESPFMRYLVPAAALRLKQGFGRLVRTRRDRGVVAILDGRVTTKGYGRVFLRSLPPARRCRTMAEVEALFAEEVPSASASPSPSEPPSELPATPADPPPDGDSPTSA